MQFLWLNLACAFSVMNADAKPGVAEIEEAVLNGRKAIRQAEIIFRSRTSFTKSTEPTEKRTLRKMWVDGEKIRNDIHHLTGTGAEAYREIVGLHCERPDHVLSYSFEKVSGGVLALGLHPMAAKPDRAFGYGVVDPRIVGLVPESSFALIGSQLNSYVGRPGRQPSTIRKVNYKGENCWEIAYVSPGGSNIRYWVTEKKGWSILRIQAIPQPPTVFSVESEVALHEKKGIWFPKKCTYEYREDGEIKSKEDLEIEVVSINESIPPETFKLSGMGIPVGTVIGGLPVRRGQVEWDGKEIVAHDDPAAISSPPSKHTSSRRKVLLFCNAVAFALIAAVAWLKYWFKKKRQSA